jgi:hypothetical protein
MFRDFRYKTSNMIKLLKNKRFKTYRKLPVSGDSTQMISDKKHLPIKSNLEIKC